ncbi:hypothetical protein IFM89_032825 [Coptis chinensis]|uniref:Uncharacterized protein n=1 Tax=Coptis chinensis TaxID=261450 RepID=A0A835HRK6_9MAGN|nr:hypothetical protein IFM89_032825 [Coptis chinensis]
MGLQVLWSLGLMCLDIYALRIERDIQNPVLVSLFVVGDWFLAFSCVSKLFLTPAISSPVRFPSHISFATRAERLLDPGCAWRRDLGFEKSRKKAAAARRLGNRPPKRSCRTLQGPCRQKDSTGLKRRLKLLSPPAGVFSLTHLPLISTDPGSSIPAHEAEAAIPLGVSSSPIDVDGSAGTDRRRRAC